jgi:hypothetical protein
VRAFEFQVGEIVVPTVRRTIIDLDSIVAFKVQAVGSSTELNNWWIALSNGDQIYTTEAAFERVLRAWQSR